LGPFTEVGLTQFGGARPASPIATLGTIVRSVPLGVRKGHNQMQMSEDLGKSPEKGGDGVVRRLVEETGITENQARELIVFLGLNWTSLLREARILKPRH